MTAAPTSRTFRVPFATALAALPDWRGRRRFNLVTADYVDGEELFALDTSLRRDLPGIDPWAGNRNMFDSEMSSPGFDPTGYHVAVASTSGALVGLCRMWRNEGDPSLGMLGVLPRYRSGVMAVDLLRASLKTSSTWGSATFATHSARPALQRHLRRVGAIELHD